MMSVAAIVHFQPDLNSFVSSLHIYLPFEPATENRPFPSSRMSPLQSESKCDVFVTVISSTLHMNEN